MGEERLSGDSTSSNQRLTVQEAAAELGITEAAIRGRIKRGTLGSYRESGAVYVLLKRDASSANRDAPTAKPTDQSELIAVLREQLEAERNAHAETRRIAYTLAQRIPEIEPPRDSPPEPRDAPEAATEGETGTGPGASDTEPPRASWWRRWFG